MPGYRIDTIGELARQLAFTPRDTRLAQLVAAEQLLLEIDPAKAYPADFIIFRVTGYHPRIVDASLFTGMALQHDLGRLTEEVSETLDLRADQTSQPVLDIDDVCQRFNVTSKTIQRWRRRGLGARRIIFADGKRRVAFLADTVERYLAQHEGQIARASNFSLVDDAERDEILRRARRLASHCGCCINEISRRIGRRMNRSPLTVLQILRQHDQERPGEAVFHIAGAPMPDQQREQIIRAYRRGTGIAHIARKICRPRNTVYRVIIEDRLDRLNKRKIRFIDDPLYHQPDAAAVINEIASQQDVMGGGKVEERRIPRDLPPYLQELYRTPLLSAAGERALFLKYNFHKFEFVAARRKLEPQFARAHDLNALEAIRRRVVETKNLIVKSNLRLVVSVARKHLRAGLSLMELISDGNLTIMRAVDSFDVHKGNRFSTYATLSLMKGYARSVPEMLAHRGGGFGEDALATVADPRHAAHVDRLMHREHVRELLHQLDERERNVLHAHYGLQDGIPATFEQVGKLMGLSKQRVRQIEQTALAKLRDQG